MFVNIFYALCGLAMNAPTLMIGLLLLYYFCRRANWRRRKREGKKRLGHYPSSVALGMAFQFLQVFYRPSVEHVIEVRQREAEDAVDQEDGQPETLLKQLHRQLRRIRRGEAVERLQLRLCWIASQVLKTGSGTPRFCLISHKRDDCRLCAPTAFTLVNGDSCVF